MQVALLSSIELCDGPERRPRGFAGIGGRNVLQRQLDFALSIGCERIACLADAMHPELLDLQHSAERAGASFHAIRDARPLAGLVKADDRLLVIGDGVVFDQQSALVAIGETRKILVFPADEAVSRGFERLDRERAWAGLMLVSGTLVERLADLPSDIDPQSSLLRLALQAATPTAGVSPDLLVDRLWASIHSANSASDFEESWLKNSVATASFAGPLNAVTDRMVLAALRRQWRLQNAAFFAAGLSVSLLASAFAAGWYGYPIAGLATAIPAIMAYRFSGSIRKIAIDDASESGWIGRWVAAAYPLVIDVLIVALVMLAVPNIKKAGAGFAAAILLGLLRLATATMARSSHSRLQDMFTDRSLLIVALIISGLFGVILPVIQLFGAALLILLLLRNHGFKLT